MTSETCCKQSRWSHLTIIVSGAVSGAVLVYAASIHALLLLDAVAGSHRLSQVMTPSTAVAHGTICATGTATAVIFISHAFRNKALSVTARLLWLVALASGYGLVFYWYTHIKHSHSEKPAGSAVSRVDGQRRVRNPYEPSPSAMCQQCSEFSGHIDIKVPADLEQLIARVSTAVANKCLEITDGDLQWSDHVACDVRCTRCGAAFRLACETYHGAGGSWEPQ